MQNLYKYIPWCRYAFNEVNDMAQNMLLFSWLFFKKNISIYFSGRIDFAEDEAFVKKTYTDVSESTPHFKKFLSDQDKKTEKSLMVAKDKNEHEFTLPHPIWSHDEADSVKITHRAPKSLSDR